MDDLTYNQRMAANTDARGNLTNNTLGRELKTTSNQKNFSTLNLTKSEMDAYEELGHDIYNQAADMLNQDIRTQNEQIFTKEDIIKERLTPQQYIQYAKLAPDFKDKASKLLFSNEKDANYMQSTLQIFAEFEEENQRKVNNEEYAFGLNKYSGTNQSLADFENLVAIIEKRIGSNASPEKWNVALNALKEETGVDFTFDPQSRTVVATDNNGNQVPIIPSFWDHVNAFSFDILTAVGAGFGITAKVGAAGYTGGKALGITGALDTLVAGITPFVEDLDLMDNIAAWAPFAGELVLNLIPRFDAEATYTKADALFGRKKQLKNLMDKVEYSNAWNEAITNAGITAGLYGGFYGAGKIWNAAKAVKNSTAELYNSAKDVYNAGSSEYNAFSTKDRIKSKVKDLTKSYKEVTMENMKSAAVTAFKAQKNDDSLTLNNVISKSRDFLDNIGLDVSKTSDFGVLATIITGHKQSMEAFLTTMNKELNQNQLRQLRDVFASQSLNFTKVFKTIADDKIPNTSIDNWFKNFAYVRTNALDAIESLTKEHINQEIKLDSKITKLLPMLYEHEKNQIRTILENNNEKFDKIKLQELEALGLNRPSLRAVFDKNIKSTNEFLEDVDTLFTTNVADVLKLRAELELKTDMLLNKNISQESINDYKKIIDNALENLKFTAVDEAGKPIEYSLMTNAFRQKIADVQDIFTYLDKYKKFNHIFDSEKTSLSKLSATEKSVRLRNVTEQLLGNPGDAPDLNTLAKMLSPVNADTKSIRQTANDLETNLVRHIIDKPFVIAPGSKDVGTFHTDIKQVLKWFAVNEKHLTSPQGKALAEYSKQMLNFADNFANLASNVKLDAEAAIRINAGLSTSMWRSLYIRYNTWRLQFLSGKLGKLFKSELARQYDASMKMAYFFANPLDIKAPERLKQTIIDGVNKGTISPEEGMEMAKEMGETMAAAKKFQDFEDIMTQNANEIDETFLNMSDAEAINTILRGNPDGNN